MQKLPTTLPAGLVAHCAKCNLVIPSDAPLSANSDCEFIAKHKLAWFNVTETPAGQHVQAVATWGMIHDAALKANEPLIKAYHDAFRASRKAHFQASAVRNGMTEQQVADGLAHRRDGALYK